MIDAGARIDADPMGEGRAKASSLASCKWDEVVDELVTRREKVLDTLPFPPQNPSAPGGTSASPPPPVPSLRQLRARKFTRSTFATRRRC